MADRTLVAALVIKAVNQASGTLRRVNEDLKAIRQQGASMREAAGTVALVGTAMEGAGLGMAYGLKKVIDPAMEVEDALHRISNSLPEHTDKLRDLAAAQAAAEATSNRLGISQAGLLKQIYLGTSAGLDMAESIAAMKVASEASVAANGELESMQRTLNLAYINFKDPSMTAAQNIQNLGNIMVTAAEKFDYKDINELREQLELATPTAKATGTEFKDLVATLADFTRHGLTGSVAGAAFEEALHGVLVMQQKLGIQIAHNSEGGLDYAKSLQNVRDHFIQLYGSMKAIPVPIVNQLQSAFGIRGIRALLIDKSEVVGMRQALDTGLLTTSAGAAERTSEAINQVRILKESFTNMAVDIGTTVLPAVVSVAQAITPVIHSIAAFAKSHQALVRMAVELAAVAAAGLILSGAIALGTASVMGFLAVLPLLAGMATAIGVVTTAMTGLNTAMLLNPIGLTIAGVVAFAAAAYEVYKHWTGIKALFASIPGALIPDLSGVRGAFALVWSDIRTGAGAIAGYFKNWGAEILDYLASPFTRLPGEIRKAAGAIEGAAKGIASRVARLFVGHSPIPEGPLHDLNLGRQIALSFRPAELASAARRAAAGVALAIPLAIASPAFAVAAGPTLGMAGAHTSAAPTVHNVINVAVHHRGGDDDLEDRVRAGVEAALAKSGHQIANVLRRHQRTQDRLEF